MTARPIDLNPPKRIYTMPGTDPQDTPNRFRVQDESELFPDNGLITIAHEDMSSAGPKAVQTGTRGAIDLTDQEARFVYNALGTILRGRGAL